MSNNLTREAVLRQIEWKANAIQGHTNEDLLTVSAAMSIVIPLLDMLEHKEETIKELRDDLDALRRLDTEH